MAGTEEPVTEEVVELEEDSDDDFEYEEVDIESDDDVGDDVSEDLDAAIRSLQKLDPSAKEEAEEGPVPGTVVRQPEVLDDFLRNFLVKMGMQKTLETFEAEWYELAARGQLNREDIGAVPDIYTRNQELDDALKHLRVELHDAKAVAGKATGVWDKFRKERDFHRMHHKRVSQEKNKLINDIKRLRKHYSQYEPTIKELRHKYEVVMKEKMLVRLERDRLVAKMQALEAVAAQAAAAPAAAAAAADLGATGGSAASKKGTGKRSATAAMPAADRPNPHAEAGYKPADVKNYRMEKTFKGHLMSVSNVAVHPSKPIIATASDDCSWKMWSVPAGELIMSGDGHKDWVAGVAFHPLGAHLASTSGDCTVKLWDFEKAKCSVTFTEHTQAVWDAVFHDTGDFLVSCSLDHSARLWDLAAGKCRQTLRGHVDSVNGVCWQPFTNNVCTGSSDKTVSLWDARSGLCVQTFYGHFNSCNDVAFNLRGDTIASADADGVVKLWDVRMVAELMTINCGPFPANKCAFDRSGQVLAVASDDSKIKLFSLGEPAELITELQGHDDAVQAVAFDPAGQYLVSASSDKTFRLWR